MMDISPDVHLFAVFDGHGGKEVALYCERHMPKLLKANEDF
jgi:serine/threonine protein phosphatase PrpC